MKFGNWEVTPEGITHSGEPSKMFEIKTAELADTITDEEEGTLYKWIVEVTDEEWITSDDLYDFNFAFVYAVAKSELEFSYEIMDESLAYQFDSLDDEEED